MSFNVILNVSSLWELQHCKYQQMVTFQRMKTFLGLPVYTDDCVFKTKKTWCRLHFKRQMIWRPCCLKLPFTISVYLPDCCHVRKKQYESWSVTDYSITSSGRNWFLLSDWHLFLTFSSILQHTEVLHWPALNPISNKTRCPASSPGVTTTITQECILFSG